jgi:hypothetical protein
MHAIHAHPLVGGEDLGEVALGAQASSGRGWPGQCTAQPVSCYSVAGATE